MDIKDLKYIAMEGGGGKGAVYAGAIEAIEELLKKQSEGCKDIVAYNSSEISRIKGFEVQKPLGWLDYYELDSEKPKIEGIAGSSAGAITAFALSLGLNSENIQKVLDFPFKSFLSETDFGVYRGVSQKSGQIVLNQAQDKKHKIGGAMRIHEYGVDSKGNVWGNPVKGMARVGFLNVCLEAAAIGAVAKFNTLQKLITKLNFKDWWYAHNFSTDVLKLLDASFMKNISPSDSETHNDAQKITASFFRKVALNALKLFKKFRDPIKLNLRTLSNVLWDRGAYSGFEVREFFFEIILFAAVRDTHFHRKYIEYLSGTIGKENAVKIQKDLQSQSEYAFGKRTSTLVLEPLTKMHLEKLKTISFEELYEITGILLGFNVTNFTTDLPMYFSHVNTPDYPVMEACGGAMSIPPAIKPLYSDADVYRPKDYSSAGLKVKVKLEIEGKWKESSEQLTNENGDLKDKNNETTIELYDLLVAAVKTRINSQKGTEISLNNPIHRFTFLPLLRKMVLIDKDTEETVHELEGRKITVDRNLMIYIYNATFKGMYMDGGVTNNIPFNFFRDSEFLNPQCLDRESLKNVLALKLDNNFPPEWIYKFKEKLKKNKFRKTDSLKQLGKKDRGFFGKLIRVQFGMMVKNYNKRTAETLGYNFGKLDTSAFNKKCWEKFIDGLLNNLEYSRFKGNPWQKKKGIFGVIETLRFGSEQGQTRHVSDHKHIVPLYSYGVGTYDFDLKSIEPLVLLAQTKAKNDVKKKLKCECAILEDEVELLIA